MIIDVEFIESESVLDVEFNETIVIDNTRYPVVEPLTVTDNGEYHVNDETDGFNPVVVSVPKRKEEQSKTLDVVENGSYVVNPDGEKVLSSVIVNVSTPVLNISQVENMLILR